MPTLRVVHSIEWNTLDRLDRISETLASGNSREILAAIRRLERNMATRIEAVTAKFDTFVEVVLSTLADLEAAKVEAVRADDADEDDALAVLVGKIDAAMANIRPAVPPPVEPPIEE